MLTDFAALGLAWFGFRIARRPADWKRTYGYDRFSVLAAFVNGLALMAISVWITVEAVRRLMAPVEVLGGMMLAVAIAGLVVNILAFWVLHGADRSNLNIRAAAVHVMGDLLGSVGAIAASLIIIWTGWTPIDPILSFLVTALILRSAWLVTRDSGRVLLEAAPRDFDARKAKAALEASVPGVTRIHHLHAWSITEDRPMATLEATIEQGTDRVEARAGIKRVLAEEFGIDHATVEISEG
jgi:cobalt-zinc-cadmium efflux system protein